MIKNILLNIALLSVFFGIPLRAQLRAYELYYKPPGEEYKFEFFNGSQTVIREAGTSIDIYIYADFGLAGDSVYKASGANILNREATNSLGFQRFVGLVTANNPDGDIVLTVENNGSFENAVLSVTSPVPQDPDLYVRDVFVDGSTVPRTFRVGETVSVRCRVTNGGQGASGSSSLGYFIGRSINDLSDRWGSDGVNDLPPLNSSPENKSYTFTESDIGTRYFLLQADRRDEVSEANENNNVFAWGPFTVEGVPRPGDFTNISPEDGTNYTSPDRPSSLDWSNASDATEYEVYLEKGDPSPDVKVATVNSTEWALAEDLSEGTWYWKVVATNSSGSREGLTWSFTVDPQLALDDATLLTVVPPVSPIVYSRNYPFTVRVKNTGNTTRSFWVGLSLVQQLPTGGFPAWPTDWHDVAPKESSILAPGEEEEIFFKICFEPGIEAGSWFYAAAIWDGYDESSDLMVPDPGLVPPGPFDSVGPTQAFLLENEGYTDSDPYSLADFDYLGLFNQIDISMRNERDDLNFLNNPNYILSDASNQPISPDNENIVVLFHGWNNGSADDEMYTSDGAMGNLLENWTPENIPPNWTLYTHEWGRDANFPLDWAALRPEARERVFPELSFLPYYEEASFPRRLLVANALQATDAAVNGYMHGLMAARKLLMQTDGAIKNITIIGYSAGAWGALGATQALSRNLPPDANIQIVYCDPYIPGNVLDGGWRAQFDSEALRSGVNYARTPEWTYQAQAYHHIDLVTDFPYSPDLPTTPTWTWPSTGLIVNVKDMPVFESLTQNGHGRPIEFYGRSISEPRHPDYMLAGQGSVGWALSLANPPTPDSFENLEPNNQASYISPDQPLVLDWEDSPNAISYDVFLAQGAGVPLIKVATVADSTWTVNQTFGTGIWSWRVVANNPSGSQEGDTWTFDIRLPEVEITPTTNPSQSGAAGSYVISVTSNGAWSAVSSQPWATLSPGNGNGNGTVTVNVSENPSTTSSRSAVITIGGQTHNLTQLEAEVVTTITPTSNPSQSGAAGSYAISVTSNGAWSAVSSQPWATLSPGNGNGNGTVTVNVSENPSTTSSRSAVITIGGQTHNLTQLEAEVVTTITPTSNPSQSGAAGSYAISVTSNGAWSAVSSQTWATLSPGNGNGNGTVTVNVSENPSTTSPRSAVITIGGQTHNLTQLEAEVVTTITPTSNPSQSGAAGSYAISVTSNGAWSAVSSQPWATLSPANGNGNGTVTVNVSENPSTTSPRSAVITIGGQTHNLTQLEAEVVTTITPTSNPSQSGAAGSYAISVTSNGAWSAVSSQPWATLSPGNGNGNGTVTVNVSENPSTTSPRSAVITIGGQTHNLTQLEAEVVTTITPTSNPSQSGAAGSYAISVTSNGAWSAVSSQPWATLSPGNGNGNGTVTVNVSENPSTTSPRSAVITIGGQTHNLTQLEGEDVDTPPNNIGTLMLEAGGSLNGQAIGPANLSFTVEAGSQITGSVMVRADNKMNAGAVVPLGGTAIWGDRETQSWRSHSDIPQGEGTFTIPVSRAAPPIPGTYRMVLAFAGEYNMEQVMSRTNWTAGPVVWNDGNDVGFDWSEEDFEDAATEGAVLTTLVTSGEPRLHWLPATVVTVVVEPVAIPNNVGTVYLKQGGNLNGSSVDPSNPTITVSPGDVISGSLQVEANNLLPGGSVAPLGGTVDWGDRTSQPWLVDGWIGTGVNQFTIPVEKTAPTEPGTYHIIVSFAGEFNMDQVMSRTSWTAGPEVWNDGNDVGFDWTADDFAIANREGAVLGEMLHSTGFIERWLPTAVVTVEVSASNASFDTWIAGYPELPLDQRGTNDDPDNDGVGNAFELFRGTNPNSSDPEPLIEVMGANEDSSVNVRFWRNDGGAIPDTHLEWSPNLRDWADENETIGSLRVEYTETIIDQREGANLIQLEAKIVAGTSSGFYLRLAISGD